MFAGFIDWQVSAAAYIWKRFLYSQNSSII